MKVALTDNKTLIFDYSRMSEIAANDPDGINIMRRNMARDILSGLSLIGQIKK